ncbi:hypothetical protein MINTM005_13280 [Mycobacterium intracellulare]|uniref:hypothetical protein n=1 Tax=Mycobacterium intracellulare TaxID=1767 RepID=UPI00192948B5|nr:hypothetical protein [Mycobacterium intracellulare]BCO56084.1 hypothetical protein MINTM005_13280 [Mycobacterium intracellulare]
MADPQNRLRRVSIPIPNAALAEWLGGHECYERVAEVTSEIFVHYQNSLPIRHDRLKRQPPPGNLRRAAFWTVDRGGWGAEQDRWFGWVGNRAPYSAVIEYGSPRRNIRGQHQLRDAAQGVFGGLHQVGQVNARAERSTRTGRVGRGNTVHRALGRNSLGQFTKRNTT